MYLGSRLVNKQAPIQEVVETNQRVLVVLPGLVAPLVPEGRAAPVAQQSAPEGCSRIAT